MDAILWLLRTGTQWRNLPHKCDKWPHWQAVYYYFEPWKTTRTFERMNIALNQADRLQQGRHANPSAFCIDSESVKLAPFVCAFRGLDPHKCVNGRKRKRQFVVDTQGRLWAVAVHAANEADGTGGMPVIGDLLWAAGERLEKRYGDQAYHGVFKAALKQWSTDFEKASRAESQQGFVPVAKRWVVEGSISWTNFFRRLGKDYEYTLSSAINWLY